MLRTVPASVPSLLVFTDERAARGRARGVIETVARALAAPAPRVAVVVRAKDRSLDDTRALCRALLPVVRRAHARLLVHTHAALVGELGLDGVHLSSHAASHDDVNAARALLPAGALLGASRHVGDLPDLGTGLDYATLSPVFSPTSKPDDARPPLGLDALRRACGATSVPLLALGGITSENAAACRRAGARGVAVLGSVMGALHPRAAVQALSAAVSRG